MSPSFVRRKIAEGKIVLTAKSCYTDPEVVELMASSGVDAMWICFEHKRVDPAMACSLIQACRLGGADALIRIKPSHYSDVLWLLEAGVRGLMLPRVRHPDEVREVIAAMKFHPEGRRGADVVHVDSNYGRVSMSEYMTTSNRETFLVVQIEEPEVVPHLEEIAALPGVDVLFVGPGDLALGFGKLPSPTEPAVMKVAQDVADVCRRHGKRAGIPCAADQIPVYKEMGFTFFNVISDYRCVAAGVKQAVTTARAAVG